VKLLPLTDLALERSLIAVALHDFGRFASRGVVAEDFADHECRTIFELAAELHETGKPVTHHAIVAAVTHPDRARDLAPKLAAYRAEVPPDHDRLRHLRRLRDVREQALFAAAKADTGELDEAVAALDAAQRAAVVRDGSDTVHDVHGLADRFVSRLQDALTTRRVSVSMPIFGNAVGPLVPGSQIVVAADSNVGKTGYALELLANTAADGTPCGFISCEDPEDIITPRLIAAHARGLSSRELQTGQVPAHKQDEVIRALDAMTARLGKSLLFSFAVGGTEMDVCGEMSRMVARGARLIAIDYIQAIEASKSQQDRRNEIRWVAARIKAHAQRLGVPYILLSQLTVSSDADKQKEPTKHSLRESRDLTNASEAIIVMWRDDEADGAEITCKLVKSKIGNVGATWRIGRDENAVVREVEGSYRSGLDNFRDRQSQPQGKGWRR
jgi:replicative DNA helicase